ncbi:hypothetical protein EY653_05520 [Enterococcus faecalis]|uniref:hypothetical protein n=1 Tax=Enterococcus faecalis TaxID=1351 RepID=UPI001AD6D7B2|nr:hypothetical protein [Enterococcus faecalis]MBO6438756.1 hypothetical protein [Enterococcus faecalis]MBO6453355.1 hypothetical protein [Enterococcus faecalis]
MTDQSVDLVISQVKEQVCIGLKSEKVQLSKNEFDQQFEKDEAAQFMIRDLKKRFPSKVLSFLRVNEEVESYSLTILDSMTESLKEKVTM